MDYKVIDRYIDELLTKSTPDRPIWNIEKILQGLKSTWNYIDGCMIKALLEMYSITRKQEYFDFADAFIDYRVHDDGTIDGYDVSELNIDNVNAGKTLFELYDLTGKEKYRKATARLSSCLVPQREASGTRISTLIRYGLTVFICASHSIWNMRHVLTIRRTMMIYSFSSRTS